MDDKDFWEEEYTVLDEYQRQKQLEEVALDTSFTRDAVDGPLQRVSSTNDYIAKALERNPNGWMITSINQMVNNDLNFHVRILKWPNPEVEVNITVSDPQLIATLHHAMQGYC